MRLTAISPQRGIESTLRISFPWARPPVYGVCCAPHGMAYGMPCVVSQVASWHVPSCTRCCVACTIDSDCIVALIVAPMPSHVAGSGAVRARASPRRAREHGPHHATAAHCRAIDESPLVADQSLIDRSIGKIRIWLESDCVRLVISAAPTHLAVQDGATAPCSAQGTPMHIWAPHFESHR